MSLKLLKEKTNNLFFRAFFFLQKPKDKKTLVLLLLFFGLLVIGVLFPLYETEAVYIPLVSEIAEAFAKTIKEIATRIGILFLIIPFWLVTMIATLISIPFVGLAAELLRFTARGELIQVSLTNPATNPILQAGLAVTMPLANMVILLGFVVIAIATILGIKSYALEKTLPMLIIIALLINFAPLLCGIVVDFANIIMFNFAKSFNFMGLAKLSLEMMGDVTGDAGKLVLDVFTAGDADALMADFIGIIGQTLGGLGFNIVATLTMMLIFALLATRIVAIWILVILSPLAFAFYVIPYTKKWLTKWWEQLLQWAFVGVIAVFFMFLAMIVLENAPNIIGQVPVVAGTTEADWMNAIIEPLLTGVFPLIVMVIGFFAAMSGGAMFSGAVIAGATAIGRKAAGWAGAKTIGAAKSLVGRPGTRLYRTAEKLEKNPHVPFIKPGTLTGARRREILDKVGEEQEKIKNLSNEELQDRARQLSRKKIHTKNRVAEAVAYAKEAEKRGMALPDEARPLIKSLDDQGFKEDAKKAKMRNPNLTIDPTQSRAEQEKTLISLFSEMSTAEKRKIRSKTLEPVVLTSLIKSMAPQEIDRVLSESKIAKTTKATLARLTTKDPQGNLLPISLNALQTKLTMSHPQRPDLEFKMDTPQAQDIINYLKTPKGRRIYNVDSNDKLRFD